MARARWRKKRFCPFHAGNSPVSPDSSISVWRGVTWHGEQDNLLAVPKTRDGRVERARRHYLQNMSHLLSPPLHVHACGIYMRPATSTMAS